MPSGPALQLNFDREQRRWLLRLALLGTLVQAVTAGYLLATTHNDPRATQAVLGLVLTVALSVVTSLPHLPVRAVQRSSVGLLLGWLLMNVLSVLVTHRPITSGMLLHLTMLSLLAFSWTPARWAILVSAVGYGAVCLATVSSRVPDFPGLLLTGFLLPLIWMVTTRGYAVTRERLRSDALQELAATDELTGLHNRRAGQARLMALADLWADAPDRLSVLLLDLDHFKSINDALGHSRGDHVLRRVAELLQDAARPGEVVRWGGEEFLVILSGLTPAEALRVGEEILTLLRSVNLTDIRPLTFSGGLASLSEALTMSAVLELADQRLYQAKHAGRDRLMA
ncbi:GGDEF domain-containing protein (plasmid) [Deinococcus taeanensis]|uniref:GGDEF domain-containing protein n=1 Tax=Deinococcus taeanensis TaxID=2737050 RepID=UPI001CDD585E|nr:GGDEF domain-containing protein [Deinococcus taeanensis]UBV45219.1 GGDEF domain-containing protein [Deinococcus taeanensis]